MELTKSQLLKISLRKLFPFIILFSFYIFSYGANFPGGGFQAGVVFGTLIVIYELIFENQKQSDKFYKNIEYIGLTIIFFLLLYGLIKYGFYFYGFYHLTPEGKIFSNFAVWLFNTAIFFEVAGSIVLIFRHFISITDDNKK